MVNEHEDQPEDVEITNDETVPDDVELETEEAHTKDKLKQLRARITELEQEKQQLQDDLQRTRAEFLNAKRRLEEERERDRTRARMKHIEELLPLCDSFQMAMSDTEAWEKADASWRKGVEGIHTQLQNILTKHNVEAIDPEQGSAFDPHAQEAVGTEAVEDESLQDAVVSVVQRGYALKHGDANELIRPARVTTGTLES